MTSVFSGIYRGIADCQETYYPSPFQIKFFSRFALNCFKAAQIIVRLNQFACEETTNSGLNSKS